MKKELDLDVTVKAGNDANVAALGEMWQGGGKGYSNLVAVTLGTGVGGGIIIDGRILTGTNGAGGEIGHVHVEDDEHDVTITDDEIIIHDGLDTIRWKVGEATPEVPV